MIANFQLDTKAAARADSQTPNIRKSGAFAGQITAARTYLTRSGAQMLEVIFVAHEGKRILIFVFSKRTDRKISGVTCSCPCRHAIASKMLTPSRARSKTVVETIRRPICSPILRGVKSVSFF
ncbi:hypothetical protein [uncultured Parasutterella sp.]|uniref:hypothetical protein n=1 Tax=uncultured Parasutterella sp. TaxID=1263098 RepID=UPI002588D104|nr:hypothetical protein [uncultured Parasutterella sp.]